MLTSYVVRCPHKNCRWSGSLMPSAKPAAPWENSIGLPVKKEVVFECPKCRGVWHARIVGDDVRALPVEVLA